ncbi:hypothetical protein DERP_009849 [Dermatophagoides pteronyssinus]|uniref:Uncharacterized protein n=1 Tax=Dermatophagoides pteronyssinus TaxID=6956 RepID=A0ABQ8IRC1_DERPT|nr:hypothetical protein DERP_009849 [Dermatophagoides pteronyssinus]
MSSKKITTYFVVVGGCLGGPPGHVGKTISTDFDRGFGGPSPTSISSRFGTCSRYGESTDAELAPPLPLPQPGTLLFIIIIIRIDDRESSNDAERILLYVGICNNDDPDPDVSICNKFWHVDFIKSN